jgi:hypothetical protein
MIRRSMRQHAQRAVATFERLRKKLKSPCASIKGLASLAGITTEEVEMLLYNTYREHDIDMVAAGSEKVGPDPIFIARLVLCPKCGRRHRAEIALYSALPADEWRVRPPEDEPWVN